MVPRIKEELIFPPESVGLGITFILFLKIVASFLRAYYIARVHHFMVTHSTTRPQAP